MSRGDRPIAASIAFYVGYDDRIGPMLGTSHGLVGNWLFVGFETLARSRSSKSGRRIGVFLPDEMRAAKKP